MKQIWAIARLTLKAAFRFKIVALLAIFLIISVFALPMLLKNDGTARGFVQILLTYSMGLTVTVLALSTLWLSCSLLARDIEDCRIQMLVVKPIARWKIWVGRWVGIMIVNVLLLGLSGAVVYGLLQYRGTQLNEDQRHILSNEIFVARGSAKEPPVDLTAAVEEVYQQRIKQSANENALDKDLLRKQIKEMLKYQYQLVPSGMMRKWEIPLGSAASHLRDKPLYLKTKFIAMSHNSTFEDTRSFPMRWEIGPENSPQTVRMEVLMTPNMSHELKLPPNLLDENGVLNVRFINHQEETFFFDMNDGMEILYRQGSFWVNYIKGLVIMLCWLSLLASIGLAASSFLSFPVASFFAVSLLIFSLCTGTMSQVIEEGGIAGVNHETGKITHQGVFDKAFVTFFKGTRGMVNLVKDFSPVELLSQGRTITWGMLIAAIWQIVVMVGGLFAAIGMICLSRRELALVKGGHG